MKKIVSVSAFALFALLLSFAAVHADAVGSPGINIVLTGQSPYPAEPGQNVNIEIEIQNNGYADADNRIVEIMIEDPFELLPGEEKTKLFNKISARDSVKTSYNFFVNESALTNNYELKFRIYTSGTPDIYIEDTVTINVRGVPDLMITSIQTEPENIEPGGLVNIMVTIENIGTGTARQVKAQLNSTSSYILPVLTGGFVLVGDIEPKNTSQTELRMSIDSSAEYKTYMTTLTLFYKDENNTANEEIVDVGIPVTGSINLDIIQIEADYDRNKLEIQVANKGTTDAKSVEARLVISGTVVGIDYISQLKASKYTTFDFPLILQGSGYLEINYIGPTLQNEQVQEDIVLNYPDPRITSIITNIIILVIVLLIIRYFWKRYKKKKKQ